MSITKKNWNAPERNQIWLSLVLNETSAEIIISGQIGKNWWDNSGISGKEFRNAIDQVPKGQKIILRINSEGGSVQDGLEIYNAIKERRADVTCHISGYAVSIASVIPLAAARVISPTSSVWMIHEPWCMAQGNAEEMRATAEMLDKHGDMLAQIYSQETGKSKKAVREAMQAETWFTGKEAVEYGLADAMEEDTEDTRNSLKALDLRAYRNVPTAIFNLITPLSSGQPKPKPAAVIDEPPQEDSMIKKLVALLKKHGVEALDTENEEQLLAKLQTFMADNKAKVTRAFLKEMNAAMEENEEDEEGAAAAAGVISIRAELAQLKRDRIADKVSSYVDSTVITKDELEIFVEAAIKDEKATFKILDGKKAAHIGGANAGIDLEVGNGPELPFGIQGKLTEKAVNLLSEAKGDKAKAYAAMKNNWEYLTRDAARQDKVRNENTFSATLTTNFLILGATTSISPKFASVKMFSRDTSVDPYKPLATGVLKYNVTAQDGTTTQTNATNFESGDSTVNAVSITVAQYTESFHITNAHMNNGLRMEDLIAAKVGSLGSKVSKVLAANITAANFATLAPIVSAPGAFGFSDMAIAWGELKKANRKNIMLDGEYLARIINNPSFLQTVPVVPGAGWANINGWDYVALHTEWSAAGNNIRGFACDPQALGIIAGLPLVDSPAIPGGILSQATGILPGVDLAIAVFTWFNTATRTYWGSFDLMFGANALDTTAGVPIASGVPS